MLRCKDSGLEKGSEIETDEGIDAAVERRRRIWREGDSVEISNWALRLAPHTASERASEDWWSFRFVGLPRWVGSVRQEGSVN
jgi:hypothetical protein